MHLVAAKVLRILAVCLQGSKGKVCRKEAFVLPAVLNHGMVVAAETWKVTTWRSEPLPYWVAKRLEVSGRQQFICSEVGKEKNMGPPSLK